MENMSHCAIAYKEFMDELGQRLVVDENLLKMLFIAYFSRGHILLEGPPGTGKTINSLMFSKAIGKSLIASSLPAI